MCVFVLVCAHKSVWGLEDRGNRGFCSWRYEDQMNSPPEYTRGEVSSADVALVGQLDQQFWSANADWKAPATRVWH